MFGYSKEDMGKELYALQFIHPKDRKRAEKNINKVFGGDKTNSNQYLALRKDGSVFPALVSSNVIMQNAKPAGMRGIIIDISERIDWENKIRENEAKYRTLVEKSLQGVVIAQDSPVRLSFANRTMEEITGYAPEELLKASPEQLAGLIHPENREAFFTNFKKRIAGEKFAPRSEYKIIKKDGSVRVLASYSALIDYQGSPATHTFFIDITEQKETEKALQESRAQYRILAENSADIIYKLNIKSEQYTYVSPSVEKILGYTANEIYKMKAADVLTAASYKLQLEKLRKTLAIDDRNNAILELEAVQKNGGIIPIEAHASFIFGEDGNPVEVLGVARDISERRQAEQALRENEAKLRSIVEHSTNLFYSHTPDHRLTYLSPQVEEILGYSQEVALVKWTDLTTDNPINEAGLKKTIAAIETCRKQPPYELELKHKNGKKVRLEIREAPVVENGKTIAIVGAAADITERKKAEEELRTTQLRLTTIFNNLPDIVLYETGGNREFISENIFELTGYTAKELVKNRKSFPNLIHPEDNPILDGKIKEWHKKGASGVLTLQFRFRHKNGNYLWLEDRMLCIRTEDGNHYMTGVIVDITDRKIAEKALTESEAKYRNLVENANDAIYLLRGRRYEYVNPRFCELTGYSFEELTSPDFDYNVLVPPETHEFFEHRYQGRLEGTDLPDQYDVKVIRKNGDLIDIEVTTVSLGIKGDPAVLGIMRDVTERKQAEKALVASEQKYRQLFESSLDGICSTDLDGRFLDCNPAYERMTGYSIQELRQIDFKKITPKKWHKFESEIIHNRIKKEGYSGLFEKEYIRKDGTVFPVELSVFLVNNEAGKPTGMWGIFRDITERKQAEEAIKESEARLKEAQEIAHIGHWNLDLKTDELIWSEEVYRIFGVSEATFKVTREGFLNLVHPEDRNIVRNSFEQAIKRKNTYDVMHRIVTPSGEQKTVRERCKIYLNEYGDPYWTLGTVQDITEQKKAEEALRLSEERFRAFFEDSQLGVFIWDTSVPIRYVAVNEPLAELNGFAAEKHVDKTLGEVIEDSKFVNEQNEVLRNILRAKRPITFESSFNNRNGRLIHYITQYFPLFGSDDEIVGVGGIVQDITETKKIEAEAKRWSKAFAYAEWGVAIIAPEGNILELLNPAFAKMHGYTEDELLKESIEILLNQKTRKQFPEFIERAKRKGHHTFEFQHIRKDGAVFPVFNDITAVKDIAGSVQYFVFNVQDMTEVKKAEQALIESERKYKTVIDNSLEGISITQDKILKFCNQRFCDMFGFENPEEAIGTPVKEMVHPRSWDLVKEEVESRETGQRSVSHYIFFAKQKNGTEFEVETLGNGIIFEGKPAVQAVMRDLSEQRKLEAQLQQAQKMELIGRLAGGVAHDFNNRLTVICGNAELALSSVDSRDPLNEDLKQILASGNKAADLTRQLLAFSRKQTLQPKVLDINKVLLNLNKMLVRLIGEDIHLTTKLQENLWSVFVDPGQIEQVIINLAINARDAMPESGEFRISTCNLSEEDVELKKRHGITRGKYIKLEIADTGIGMDDAVLSKIFDPFFTTKAVGKGTGLGLSTVYGIIKQSKGYIYVDSEPGKGTTFEILLPAVEMKAPLDEVKLEDRKNLKGNETILIVEDEDSVRMIASRALKSQGYKILEARNGGEAYMLCKKLDKPVDLVITDVIMPNISGTELIENLKTIWTDFKALYMSGYTKNEIIENGVLDENVPYIQKPFMPVAIAKKVREILDGMKNSEDLV